MGVLDSPQATAAVIAGLVALVTSVLTALITILIAQSQLRQQAAQSEEKLRREFKLDYAAETVAHELLQDAEWRLRSFDVIEHHLAGFTDDELRKVLVRAGAVCFRSKAGKELWGLLSRNRDRLGIDQIDDEPGRRPLVRESDTVSSGGGGGIAGYGLHGPRYILQDKRRD